MTDIEKCFAGNRDYRRLGKLAGAAPAVLQNKATAIVNVPADFHDQLVRSYRFPFTAEEHGAATLLGARAGSDAALESLYEWE